MFEVQLPTKEDDVRVTTAFNRMLGLPGAWVRPVARGCAAVAPGDPSFFSCVGVSNRRRGAERRSARRGGDGRFTPSGAGRVGQGCGVLGETADDLAKGRRRGRDLLAFRKGLSVLPAPVDIFVKVDADTSFDPNYFARLLEHFQLQPDLGIAGGSCYELVDGAWQRMKVSHSHPRGASRAYRWALLDDVFALEPELGWDGVDEVMAELRGYRTAAILDLGFRHHRRVGEREGRLRAGTAEGRQAWYMGYRPSYLILRALYRARENAAQLAMVCGYGWAAVSGAPQCPNPIITNRIRESQRLRVVVRRGGWS
jgi:hypothetical protein